MKPDFGRVIGYYCYMLNQKHHSVMKRISPSSFLSSVWFLSVVWTCIVCTSCAQDRTTSEAPPADDRSTLLDRADADAKKIKNAQPFGSFMFSDGTFVGNNVSIEMKDGELLFYVIGMDKNGKTTISDPYPLPRGNGTDVASEGVEIELFMITEGDESRPAFTVSKCGATFAERDRLPVRQHFDLKICKGGPATNGQPSIIGIDDGRNLKSSGEGNSVSVIKDWKNARIRIHRVDDATTDCVLSDQTKRPAVGPICYWSTGQTLWGKKFENRFSGCP